MSASIKVPVVNWKGEFTYRHIEPQEIEHKKSDYHGEAWHLSAYDYDKEQMRGFDLTGIIKGVIVHTLKEAQVVVTPERVEGVLRMIEKRYKEQQDEN